MNYLHASGNMYYYVLCVCVLPLGCSHRQQVVHNSHPHGYDRRNSGTGTGSPFT